MQTTLFGAPPENKPAPAVKMKSDVSIKIPSNVNGRVFLTNTGKWFAVDRINVNTIQKHSANPYYAIKRSSVTAQIFTGEPKIEIINPDGELDEELTKFAKNMLYNLTDWNTGLPVSIYQHQQASFLDVFDGGAGIFEPVWANVNGWTYLYALNRLPWTTFKDLPDGFEDSPSALLKGIVVGPDGKLQYWQMQDDGQYHQIENVLHIRNPQSHDLAGDPLSLPILPIIEMLNFTWDLNRMKDARIGAPSIFVEMLTSDDDTVKVATDIITNWGAKTQFAHSENIKVYNLPMGDSGSLMSTIEGLEQILDAIYNPAAMVQKQGTLIGGSDAAAERLLYSQSNTFLSWLDLGFTSLLQKWLQLNMFSGYLAKMTLPKLESDKSASDREEVAIGYNTKTLTLNERRRRLGEQDATDEVKAELQEEFSSTGGLDMTSSPFLPTIQNSAKQNTKTGLEDIEDLTKKAALKLLTNEYSFEKKVLQAVGVSP